MDLQKAAALTMIAGSVLFLAAAFSPISRIFGIPDPGTRLEIITGAPIQWQVAQLLFALGALVTALGVGLLALRSIGQPPAGYLAGSTACFAAGALLWSRHVHLRAVDPSLFTAGEIPFWLFASYSLLTMAGLALLGTAILHTALPSWVGWLSIGSTALFLVLALVFGDMPPFVYYLLTFVVGVVLYRDALQGGTGWMGAG